MYTGKSLRGNRPPEPLFPASLQNEITSGMYSRVKQTQQSIHMLDYPVL